MADEQQSPPDLPDEPVADILERTHAAVTAAIAAGLEDADQAMQRAEAAVAQAVTGAAKALRAAQEAARKS